MGIALSLAAANVGQAFQPDRVGVRRGTARTVRLESLTYVAAPATKKPKFELKDGDRVVFLGNTLIEREQQYGYWETMLTARYPDRKILFRNLGWDGDTVWAESRGLFDPPEKGYARMLAHVGRIKPTVVFLGYGNNEAFAGKAGLPRFVKQYNKLLDDLTRVSAKGVRFVLLSPYLYEKKPAPMPDPSEQNRNIRLYADAIRKIASQRMSVLIDFIKRVESRKSGRLNITENGIQLSQFGWQHTAQFFPLTFENSKEQYLLPPSIGVSSDGKVWMLWNYKITDVKAAPSSDRIRFKATPTSVGDRCVIVYSGCELGEYAFKLDGKRVDGDERTRPRKLVTRKLNRTLMVGIHGIGDAKQHETLRQAIIAKNRLYFHSWRPQNVTYLFLFRKHEQGQNAKEMQEFERLVAAKEQEIDRLKKPVTRTYELVRVKPKAKGRK